MELSFPAANDPATIGSLVADRFAGEELAGSKHYKTACAWYGALAQSRVQRAQTRLDALIAKYTAYQGTWGPLLGGAGHVDENVFGIVPLEIALHTGDAKCTEEGLALAEHQRRNLAAQTRFAVDDMFMITALQVQAYRVSRELKYLDTSAALMGEYLERLQQPDGLFRHHERFPHRWARGNGWFAAGMVELLRELPSNHPNYPRVRAGYDEMMRALLAHQIADGAGAGLWKQLVDSGDERNLPETSGSAMFTYALVSGVRAGWLEPATYGAAARRGWLALVARLDPQGRLRGISDWAYKPESHPESGTKYVDDEEGYYFDRPRLTGDHHGQAPLLWCAAALQR